MTLMEMLQSFEGSNAERDIPSRSVETDGALTCEAIVFSGDGHVDLAPLDLNEPGDGEVVIDIEWSGVSTGTERLLFTGDMPPFPGLGYPLVPGYESVGVVRREPRAGVLAGRRVFVPGSKAFVNARGLFGASASTVVAPADKLLTLPDDAGADYVLLALAATARHAIGNFAPPDLIIGHGVLGRLLARVTIALGAPPPVVWEIDPERADSDEYPVLSPDIDGRTDYNAIYDVSGDREIIDQAAPCLARGGEIVLAGFYSGRVSFAFPPVFMKEARLRAAAEWTREDLEDVLRLVGEGRLSFGDLVTHRHPARDAQAAYETAFGDSTCLKMALNWRDHG